MPSEGAALVEEFNSGWNDRDLARVLTCIDDEMEFDWSDSIGPLSGIYRGYDGMRNFWRETWDAWEEFAIEVEEVIEVGSDRLVTPTTVRARGKGSGVDVEARGAMIWTLQNGTIRSGRFFQTREEALKAASSESTHPPGNTKR
jgi:ketosteroid isomerase-like protein